MDKGSTATEAFDLKLAIECANAYAVSTGLGCTLSDTDGVVHHSTGLGCSECQVCRKLGENHWGCIQASAYGMTEAERFGGKYIYFCPRGLTCFVSPIIGNHGSAAKITVGPFLMVDLDDYIAFELEESMGLDQGTIEGLIPTLQQIPVVPSHKVNALSHMLFMSVSFMNDVSAANRMLEDQDAEQIQGQISEYILELKRGEAQNQYPLETERKLLDSIIRSDKPQAQKLLNELLGYILFSSGGDFSRIKTRVYELLVVISRAAADAGASPESTFELTHNFITKAQNLTNIEELSYQLAAVMNRFIDSLFSFRDSKNMDIMHKALQYMRQNYDKKITLDSMAQMVHLSPSYFSKIFKAETGYNFNTYLNKLRIDKSKKLLLYDNIPLVSIVSMVGFEDQSYFTKVFKRLTGISPLQYRKKRGAL